MSTYSELMAALRCMEHRGAIGTDDLQMLRAIACRLIPLERMCDELVADAQERAEFEAREYAIASARNVVSLPWCRA